MNDDTNNTSMSPRVAQAMRFHDRAAAHEAAGRTDAAEVQTLGLALLTEEVMTDAERQELAVILWATLPAEEKRVILQLRAEMGLAEGDWEA